MSVREVASAEFYQLSRRSEGKLLVTQFTATWCGPCRRVAPQYEALARRMPEVEFVKVYEHNSRDAIMASGVRSFPTFHFYLGGAKVDECRGANIAQVEQKASQHMAAASAAGGPVMIKLRFEREKPRESGQGFILVAEETELEVHASEGLEIFKFQVLSLTDIETDDQSLTAGDSATPIASDADLTAALRRTGGGVYGNYPVIRVSKRAVGKRGGVGGAGAPAARKAAAEERQGATAPPNLESCCSRTFFGKKAVVQPAYVIREESLLPELTNLQKKKAGPEAILIVCKACAENCFVPGRAEHSPAISSRAAFVCQAKEACVEKGYGSDLFSGRADAGAEVFPPGSPATAAAESAAATAADAVYYAARGLPVTAGGSGSENEDMAHMRRRIEGGMSGVLVYEDPALQEKARAVLPPADGGGGGTGVAQKGAEMAAAGGFSEEEGLARALLSWFKKDFFKWTNKPACSGCGGRGACMQPKGVQPPTPEEASSRASRVEVYACKDCGAETRYPRYNDPAKLLETRNGRCGEWANCFTLMCRAVGLEARSALDWTDHVWTEIWIPAKSAWVHADPCENKLDKPLMYEHGWNKRLSYVLAFDRNGAIDVTPRYTRRWLQVLSRRNLVPEKWLAGVLAAQSRAATGAVVSRLAEEQRQLKEYESAGYDGNALDSEETEGRQSGDAEWVASRGEDGGGAGGGTGALATNAQEAASLKPPATSPLVGVPVGVPQSGGGGLAICVAAVVERSGDASVLVGGAAVCRLAGRGRAALCAAAVSSATGVLLDAKTFVLGDGQGDDSSAAAAAVTDWLTGLPDGAVVAVAAGGGGGGGGSSGGGELGAMDAGLAEAMAKLVGDGSSSSSNGAEGEATQAGSAPTGGFTLVGFKSAGPQNWARRQHRATQQDKGGRCAVYAELVLPPPPAAAGHVDTPRARMELRDKLALCPLRSVPSDDDASSAATVALSAPARGLCSREGEPTVSVGPGLDLVDCPGWTTTVLEAAGGVTASGKGEEEVPPSIDSVAWRVATVHPAVGGTHEDTEEFDDSPVGCPAFVMGGSSATLPDAAAPLLPAGRVREIIGWSGDSVNGVQVVYDVEGDVVRGPKRVGDHGLYRQSKIVLDVEGGEVLTSISVKAGAILDSLCVRTSKGQEKRWGGGGGHLEHTWHVPPGASFLGFHGGMGGHVHSLGVTLAEAEGQAGGQAAAEISKRPFISSPRLTPIVKTNLYAADPVTRACGQFVALNSTPSGEEEGLEAPKNGCLAPAEVITALETMHKYADNLLASPLDPKFSRIRLANGFFDRKIGRLPGGGGVVRAMGFELAVEGGRMHYVFRRNGPGAKGGLDGLRRARRALIDVVAVLKPSAA
ncbi:unnamed protein product [Scytosiphon promiscuus]